MKWKDKLDLTHGEHISKQVSDSTNTFYIWQMSKWTSHRPCCITGLVFYQYHEITSFIRSYSLKKRISVKTFSNPAGSLTHAILKDSLGNSGKSCAEMNDDSPRGSWATWGESVCTPWPASEASTRSLQVIRMNQNGFRLVCLKNANTFDSPKSSTEGRGLASLVGRLPKHLPPAVPMLHPGPGGGSGRSFDLRLAATVAAFPTQGLAGRSWRGTGFY